jgi:hypothetical protein
MIFVLNLPKVKQLSKSTYKQDCSRRRLEQKMFLKNLSTVTYLFIEFAAWAGTRLGRQSQPGGGGEPESPDVEEVKGG